MPGHGFWYELRLTNIVGRINRKIRSTSKKGYSGFTRFPIGTMTPKLTDDLKCLLRSAGYTKFSLNTETRYTTVTYLDLIWEK